MSLYLHRENVFNEKGEPAGTVLAKAHTSPSEKEGGGPAILAVRWDNNEVKNCASLYEAYEFLNDPKAEADYTPEPFWLDSLFGGGDEGDLGSGGLGEATPVDGSEFVPASADAADDVPGAGQGDEGVLAGATLGESVGQSSPERPTASKREARRRKEQGAPA